MKRALNQSTLMNTPLDEFLEVSAAAGFKGVELRHPHLLRFLEDHSPRELARRLDALGLGCLSINALELFSLCPEEEFRSMLGLCDRLMDVGSQIGCRTIVAVPSLLDGPLTESQIIDQTRSRLSRIAQVASRYRWGVALEPLGFSRSSVRSLDLARRIIDDQTLPGMGLVVDTFHFFVGGQSFDDLRRVGRESIWLIHLDDAVDKPLDLLQDSDRVLPLQGMFDLRGFFATLSTIGYDGWVSVELFNEEIWAMPPREVARQAMSSMSALL